MPFCIHFAELRAMRKAYRKMRKKYDEFFANLTTPNEDFVSHFEQCVSKFKDLKNIDTRIGLMAHQRAGILYDKTKYKKHVSTAALVVQRLAYWMLLTIKPLPTQQDCCLGQPGKIPFRRKPSKKRGFRLRVRSLGI